DRCRGLEPLRRVAALGELVGERHAIARDMGGGEQLLRARLPLAPARPRRPRDLHGLEGGALRRRGALAVGKVAFPRGAGGALSGHVSSLVCWCGEGTARPLRQPALLRAPEPRSSPRRYAPARGAARRAWPRAPGRPGSRRMPWRRTS